MKLFVNGPYRHVRNPLLSAVILMIIAEAISTSSLALFEWAVAFFLLNTVYFSYAKEPSLERRFGDAY
jgi:protein-S-isoprenylcysteine O-methyltransferase Ste14